ncbi:MAG: ATP-binding protein [Acidobacteriota bacterium]
MSASWTSSGSRSEISWLVLCGLLLLIVLSSVQLFVQQDTLARLTEEQERLATSRAREIASDLATASPWPSAAILRDWLGPSMALTVFDASDRPVASSAGETDFTRSQDTLSGEASFMRQGATYRARVHLLAPTLVARTRSLRILTPLVVTVNLCILLLLLIYMRRWLRPLDLLIDRARELGQAPDSKDEVAFLMRTFERALQEMAGAESGGEGLKALEGALIRSMQSGVLLSDREGQVLALNEKGAEILEVDNDLGSPGAPLEEVLGRHPSLAELLRRAFGGEAEVQRQECSIDLPTGARELGLTAHPLRRDDGEAQGWLVMFADLTDVKRRLADERLSDNLRQIGELTAGVAHEMRNGLATLKGYLALIDRSEDRQSIDGYIREIQQETEHLHRVVEDFLGFARPGSMRTENVDLVALVQKVAADPARDDASVEVVVDPRLEGQGRWVRGDPVLLAKALGNLVSNAWQAHTGAGVSKPVILSLTDASTDSGIGGSDALEIRVEDRGAGIPREVRERLFEAFVSGRSDGVGLGLPLARRIILLHGGSIRLDPREGGGTSASVRLPAGKIVT